MPLDIPAFNMAFNRAYDRLHRSGQPADVATEQEKLRALVPEDASEDDRSWTTQLIDENLPEPPPAPPERSELYQEAVRIHVAVYPPKGTTEEQIEMLADGRRRIWEIADRADEDEDWAIRAITEDLESMENFLRNPPLTDAPVPASDG
ncbi:hypothetical protein ACIA58_38600 [Kribbella sp. NPDC051586]|uniref:hypothetical protein n=1 Tax=Kribbella sp. NPDC051586 TaxID=3364118 RepID=UPI003796F39D